MRLPVRPIVGVAAAATSMAWVILAGVTSPAAETTMHASAKCSDKAKDSPLVSPVAEAQRPA
jgi:hypothetical protein